MPVYMIRAGQHGPIKIGFSKDVAFRLVKMQADNHERLTLLRLFEGGSAEETRLHERFAESWLHGEWFAFSKAMLGDVGLQEVREPAGTDREPANTDGEFARELDVLAILWKTAAGNRPPAPLPATEEISFAAEIKELVQIWARVGVEAA